MQFIILTAGKSTRTYPLTLNKTKPLLKVANKTILEHNIEQIKPFAKEIILIVGRKKELIINLIKKKYPKLNIKFVHQKQPLGTAHALMQIKNIKDKFILFGGDDFFFKEDIKKLLKNKYALLVKQVDNAKNFGVIKTKGKFVKNIIEKPKNIKQGLVNCGCYLLDKNIFSYLKKLKKSKRGEYELTEAINELAKKESIVYIKTKAWIPITYSWDLINANEILLKNIKQEIKGKIERYVTVKGNIKLGKNSIIKSGVYIEGSVIIGENCIIGPNCYLRGSTSIGNNSKIGQAVEIKNSIIGDNTKIPHLSYIGDSVIGDNCNLGAGTITANLRHDHGVIKSKVKGELISTGRKKFGTIIGDNVHTGIKTTIYPGRKIFPGKTTLPGEIVKKDVV